MMCCVERSLVAGQARQPFAALVPSSEHLQSLHQARLSCLAFHVLSTPPPHLSTPFTVQMQELAFPSFLAQFKESDIPFHRIAYVKHHGATIWCATPGCECSGATHARTYARTHARTHTHTRCTHAHAHASTRTHTHTHAHKHTRTHTHTRTRAHAHREAEYHRRKLALAAEAAAASPQAHARRVPSMASPGTPGVRVPTPGVLAGSVCKVGCVLLIMARGLAAGVPGVEEEGSGSGSG